MTFPRRKVRNVGVISPKGGHWRNPISIFEIKLSWRREITIPKSWKRLSSISVINRFGRRPPSPSGDNGPVQFELDSWLRQHHPSVRS